ncbi:MAG: undecaprenyldiphospho-muramoylpentapeptide beta-N-acetylglucosaminyltransferase [Chthoniobacterales bacterium]|jgi:UDP-N-acetylglucosamine--N-acetylmuramyl-(pentapeptide) pyrophosphoryl-undecaprenol N-acetylglucosamine transferase|nr:undecaprenyldiphospho-muramoylpentapeptide beta-N-acetylglucosaminyltransferase [Chthoniobacterales bacterium]
MKFVVACGGTGGHLFPGLAVAEELRAGGHEILLLVSEKTIDERALRAFPGMPRESLPSVGLSSALSPAVLKFAQRMVASYRKCAGIFGRFRPDAVLGMGGFTSIAPLAAARRRGIPAYLHESNAVPGKAIRLGARFCREVLLGFEDCARHFPGRAVRVTGTPIRSELVVDVPAKARARRVLGLGPDDRTLLVMGGSQGAAGINARMAEAAQHLRGSGMQIIHLSGEQDAGKVRAAYRDAGLAAVVLPFCDRMQDAYAAADLAVSRSGAASLTELSWFGIPSILIPYPHAAEDHQTLNARIFERAGAARVLPENEATGDSLAALLKSFSAPGAPLESMAAAAQTLAPRDAAKRVAAVLTHAKQ